MSTIEQWTQDLMASDIQAQARAAEALALLGEEAQPAIVALVQACGSQDEDVCNWSNGALEAVGPPADNQIEELIKQVRSDNDDVAYWAITLLGRAQASAATEVIKQCLQEATAPQIQQRAEWALKKIEAA